MIQLGNGRTEREWNVKNDGLAFSLAITAYSCEVTILSLTILGCRQYPGDNSRMRAHVVV